MKKFNFKFVMCALFCTLQIVTFAQNNLAIVENQSGVLIFSQSRPKSKYTIIGEIFFSGESKTGSISTYNAALHTSSTYVYSSTPQYNEIKNGLVAQSIMANREVQGIIIDGKHATMLKFDNDSIANDTAIVEKIEGKYVFVNCSPISEYDYLKTKSIMIAWDDSLKGIATKLIKKCKHLDMDGVIVTLVTGGKDRAEAIKFKQ